MRKRHGQEFNLTLGEIKKTDDLRLNLERIFNTKPLNLNQKTMLDRATISGGEHNNGFHFGITIN